MQASETRTTTAAGLMDLLLRSGEALRNWKALATLMGTGVTAIIVLLALGSSGHGALMALGALLFFIILSVGMSAAGILLMDQALEMPPRSIGAAVTDGLFAALRLLGISLISAGIGLLALLATAIILFLCKIPALGSLLFAIALPVCVLFLAFVYAALYFVFSLAGSAVWSGASIRQALSTLYAIVSGRLVQAILGVIVHTILMGFTGGFLMLFIMAGLTAVGGMSAGILGSSLNIGELGGMMMGMGGHGSGSGLVYGGIFGGGILFALIGAVLLSMMILGLNRLYLHLTADLDTAGVEAALNTRLDAAKDRARAMQEEASARARAMQEETRRRAEEMRNRTAGAPAVAPTTPVAPAAACPACHGPVAVGDKFCENCGQKLG